MNLKKYIFQLFIVVLWLPLLFSCKTSDGDSNLNNSKSYKHQIPTANSWVDNDIGLNQKIITQNGIRNWEHPSTVIKTYFKTENSGKINLGLKLAKNTAPARIKIHLGSTQREVTLNKSKDSIVGLGEFSLDAPGYQTIEIKGLDKDGEVYADIDAFLIDGPATEGEVYFIKDDFYFGRRGPSVHLSFEVPKEKEVEWFYSEINVPEGMDVLGSYFMANGFKDGYFGIQVNSDTERRVLFSVWSPYETQNPDEIPEDCKIILLDKGEGVYTGEFGNEGSGGQSYKVFNWKAATTYRFLLKGVPAENNSTDYTAYFFAPEENEWQLIASFRRPHTNRYLQNLYSFLENFVPATGNISRKANYNNQWIYTTDNQWVELTKAKFTADATARKKARMDYAGGVEDSRFYMKNCGFFDELTIIDTVFTRAANGESPEIDFNTLE